MIIRESGIACGIGWTLTAWAWWLTADLAWRGDNVTSRQWQYLMSVPGHQWTWVVLFGAGAFILSLGMVAADYTSRAIGLVILSLGAGAIAAFYLTAPLIDPGLTTLGYHPWLLCAAGMLPCAVVNWRPVAWF